MDEKRIKEIEALVAGATAGPWQHTYKDCLHFMNSDFIDRKGDGNGIALVTSDINQHNATLYATHEDMEFIAASRTVIPELLATVTQLKQALAALWAAAHRVTETTQNGQPPDTKARWVCCGAYWDEPHKADCRHLALTKALEQARALLPTEEDAGGAETTL